MLSGHHEVEQNQDESTTICLNDCDLEALTMAITETENIAKKKV